jgi:hypothetical protein
VRIARVRQGLLQLRTGQRRFAEHDRCTETLCEGLLEKKVRR